ncbi:ABC-three component system middle component 1 [Acinetobacter pittii]|uniref:ABC-three component system middle component 1 n=1 Tax=Acinetobacter pittii TaxID=48296 RepID=UPI003019BC3E
MIKIINNIILNNGYELVDIQLPDDKHNIFVFCPQADCAKEEYFITIQLNNESDELAKELLENSAEELFEIIRNSGKVESYFIKNCTLFICHDETHINRETIFSLEEDPYNFKKNVITYLPSELNDLEFYLKKNNIKEITNLTISEIINSHNGQLFLNFKKSHNSIQNYYSLILKIALKLPFITYIPQKKELINLSLEIEESLKGKESVIFKNLMEPEIDWNDNNIYQNIEKIWGNLI